MFLARLIKLADAILSWLERTSWGRRAIVLILYLLSAISAWFESLPWTVWLALTPPLLLSYVLLLPAVARMRQVLQLQVIVEIPSAGLNDEVYQRYLRLIAAEPHKAREGGMPLSFITMAIHITNKSTKRRISLKQPLVIVTDGNGTPIATSGNACRVESLEMSLGPEEDSNGTLTIPILRPEISGSWKARVILEDRLSGRRAEVPAPWAFP